MKPRSQSRHLKRFLLDLILLICAALVSYYIRAFVTIREHELHPLRSYFSYLLLLAASWIVFLHIYGFYGRLALDCRSAVSKALFQVNYHAFLLVAVISFVFHLTATNRAIFALFIILANLIVLSTHWYSPLFRGIHYAIVGGDHNVLEASQLAEEIFPGPRSKSEGVFSPEINTALWGEVPFRGAIQQLFQLISERAVDTVIVAVPDRFPDTDRLLDDLEASDVEVLVAEKTKAKMQFVVV